MPLLLRSALENELHFPVSVDSPIITLPKIIIPALVQALEEPTIKLQVQALVALNKIMQIAKTWALDNDEIIGSIWKQKDTTPEERRMTFDIFHFIAEEFREQGLRPYAKYIPFLFEASKDTVPNIQQILSICLQIAARTICIYVEFDRETFKQHLRGMFLKQKDTTPEERRMTFDIFHFIAEEFREQGLRPYAKYIPFLFEASKDTVPNIQQILSICLQIAARAICIYVEFDRETFKQHLRGMFLQQKDTTPEERRMTFDIFHFIAEEFREQGLRPYAKYIPFLFEASKDTVPNIQQHTNEHMAKEAAICAYGKVCFFLCGEEINLYKMTDNTKSVASMGKDPMCSS
nr:importin-5-like [Ipomoea batatas]